MALVSMRAYAKMQGVTLRAIQERFNFGTLTEKCLVDDGGRFKKIDSEIADAEFAARRSEVAEQSDAMQRPSRQKLTPPQNVIDEMFEPAVVKAPSLLDKKLPPVPKEKIVVKEVEGQQVEVTEVPNTGNDNFERYRSAKASTESIKARLLELELAEAEERLIDVREVKEEIQKVCTAIRETILNVPAKIAPELLSCTEIVEMETKLYKELNIALEGLSRLLNARADSQ